MRIILLVLCVAALLMPGVTQAQDDECRVSYLFNAWARPTPEGAPNGAVFGLLVNLSSEPDTLLSASTAAAEVVELHETTMGEGDVMQMRPVESGLAIEPINYLELSPGGLHIMLINLTQPLEAGGTLDLLLNFEHAGEVSVTVPIVDMSEMEGMSGSEMPMSMQPETTPAVMSPAIMEWGVTCAKMHVVGAWARPAAAAMPNSAAYALLVNLTDTADTLISATAEVSAAVELHEMTMGEGDVMQMRPIEGGIPVPAGGAALLKPGGLHVMLIGLNQELEVGATMELTLSFAQSGAIQLTIPIQEPPETNPMS